jgi:hypothetical protein
LAQTGISAAIIAASRDRIMPFSCSSVTNLESFTARTISFASLSTTAFGVPAGASCYA